MQTAPRLAIDYGTACTRAVLAWPGRPWHPLVIEGTVEPSSAVHVARDGTITAGAGAWRLAADDPDGFVGAPLAEGTGTVRVRGRTVPIADLVAATLRLVAGEAIRIAGVLPADVRMSVPAGWDPARRTWLRQTAHQAGLGRPQLIEAPLAALLSTKADPPPASGPPASGSPLSGTTFALVCDVGATAEVSVVRADPQGAEVLATVSAPDAGGRAIDDRLVAMLLNTSAPDQTAGAGSGVEAVLRAASPATVAVLRTGKEAVSLQPAVTVPLPARGAAVVLSATLVEQAAEPVLRRLTELAAEALRAARLGAVDLAAVYAVGATAAMPAVSRVLERQLNVPVRTAAMPAAAVVLGVAEAAGAAAPVSEPAPKVPKLTALRALGLVAPGLASVGLFSHFVFTARGATASSWAELALAGVLGLVLCLAAGPWIGAALARDAGARGRWDAAGQISAGLLTADAFGVTVAALYAVAAGLYLVAPFGEPLQWSLLPVLPAALLAAAVAVLIRRRLSPPVIVEFPLVATLILSAGSVLFAVTAGETGAGPWVEMASRAGGALIGVGVAFLLFRIRVLQALAAVVLGVFGFFIADPRALGVFGVGVGIAVAVWWGQRLLALVRT
ncbi:Hsp70 family protein [Actinoplanes oblitus]|uniref:Hsp70 family protein n=1 Tax=Actinoplanes oblitus TaxID=3040509 RepID=A0ABY8WPZ4_9ACTN|nr:Hsp70 family protein [Actinoplanes oblitus]WIM99532.1 Hsp70 family protein [Actinoplanes oblitus]